ncbi:FAD-binding-3 domain-containing protein [Fusarium keratoplasticum]|uniref:FAD-binding-3 domain-containing protein n=1 Tax=Fusarium keratoplasticum TaxID=1328300 RepID=A0ACC0QIU6_9HYPO|nr:FAD-binding-3 domain-containing protein [Fusarium keratoplasticum]KAI8655300.1 FAD-binding-3 domain-containing protein [Fusarium keratoplasticum]
MSQPRVLICGAGIAGQAVAFWLSKANFNVTVIERYPKLRSTGLQLDLRGLGIEVMKRMGLEKAFRAKSVQEQGLEIVDTLNKRWAYFPANRSGQGLQGFTTDFEIMRKDLCDILHESTRDQVKYMFGTTVESFEQHDGVVNVTFSGGQNGQFDLVVGADGQASRTRKAMLGPDAEDPTHYLGAYIAYFTIPRQNQNGKEYDARFYLATGKRFIFTRRNDDSRVQIYMACKTDKEWMKDIRKGDMDKERQAFAGMFKGAGWETDEILAEMMVTDDFYCERLGVVQLDAWSEGRVVLVGDAAFCPSASTGMGTTSSMVGAYVLAGEIKKHCRESGNDGIPSALKAYDEKFRPFMDQVQRGLTDGESFWSRLPTSSFGVTIANVFMWLAMMLRVDVIGKRVLREDVGAWQLPDYERMVKGGPSA